jgi:hypothetical protein
MGKTSRFYEGFEDHREQTVELARRTEELAHELCSSAGEHAEVLIREIRELVVRAEALYARVWELHGRPSNDDSPLLRNVEHSLSHVLLDEYTKWIRRPADTD